MARFRDPVGLTALRAQLHDLMKAGRAWAFSNIERAEHRALTGPESTVLPDFSKLPHNAP